jgi:hypothetical protein
MSTPPHIHISPLETAGFKALIPSLPGRECKYCIRACGTLKIVFPAFWVDLVLVASIRPHGMDIESLSFQMQYIPSDGLHGFLTSLHAGTKSTDAVDSS